MSQRKGETSDAAGDVYETEYRRRKIRIEQPGGFRAVGRPGEARLFIDDEEIPIEVTENGVTSHEAAYRLFGSIDELAEDIIRQRGTAEIEKGAMPDHDHGHEGAHGNHTG